MHQNLLSFNSGELSPYLLHRSDFAKHAAGAVRMENFLPMAYGAFQKRPGTRLMGPALSQGQVLVSSTAPVSTVTSRSLGIASGYLGYSSLINFSRINLAINVPLGADIVLTLAARSTTVAEVVVSYGGAGHETEITVTPGIASITRDVIVALAVRTTISGVVTAGVNGMVCRVGVRTNPTGGVDLTTNGDTYAANYGVRAFNCLHYPTSGPRVFTRYDAAGTVVYQCVVNAEPTVGTGKAVFGTYIPPLVSASANYDGNGNIHPPIDIPPVGTVTFAEGTRPEFSGQKMWVGAYPGPWDVYTAAGLYPTSWNLGMSQVSTAQALAANPGSVATVYDRHEALLPFVAAGGEKYLLHFLPGWLEVLREDGTQAAALPWLTDYVWPAEQHPAQVQVVQLNDVAFICHPAHAPMQLSRQGDADWTLGWLPFTAAPCLDDNLETSRKFSVSAYPRPEAWVPDHTYGVEDECFSGAQWSCYYGHVSAPTNQPGVGATWPSYWRRRVLYAGERICVMREVGSGIEWTINNRSYTVGDIAHGVDGSTSLYAYCTSSHLVTGDSFDPLTNPGVRWVEIDTAHVSGPTLWHVGAGTFLTVGMYTLQKDNLIGVHPGTGYGLYHVVHASSSISNTLVRVQDWDPEEWKRSSIYQIGLEVLAAGLPYRCLQRHTPTADNAPGGSGAWQADWLLIEETDGVPVLSPHQEPGLYLRLGMDRAISETQVELGGMLANSGKHSANIVVQGAYDVFTQGIWSGTFYLEQSFDNGSSWEVLRSWQGSNDRNIADAGTADQAALMRLSFSAVAEGTSSGTGSGAYNPRMLLIPRKASVTGYALLTVYINATEMRGVASTTILSGTTRRWAKGAFSSATGYPAAVCLHERRLFFAGTAANPISVWGSSSDDMNHFELGTKDADAMFVTLAASASDPIHWMSSQRSLYLGTPMGEWTCGADPAYMAYTAPAALTPTNFQCRQYTAYGSNYLQPIKVGGALVFAGRNGTRLWELSFSSQGSAGGDLSRYAEHLTRPGLVSMARQSVRTPGLWLVTDEGLLLNLCHDAGEELLAWSRHTTAGGKFLAVAVLPSAGGDDAVFFLVRRGDRTFLEAFPQGWQAAREAGTPDMVLDGFEDGGSGIAVTSTLTLLPLDVQDPASGQPTASRMKRAHEMVLNLLASQGGGVAYDTTECGLAYPAPGAFTGWLRVTLAPAHVFDLQPSIVHATSDPFTCLAAVVRWLPNEP